MCSLTYFATLRTCSSSPSLATVRRWPMISTSTGCLLVADEDTAKCPILCEFQAVQPPENAFQTGAHLAPFLLVALQQRRGLSQLLVALAQLTPQLFLF